MSQAAELRKTFAALLARGQFQLVEDLQERHFGSPVLSEVEHLEGDEMLKTIARDNAYACR